MHDVNIMRFEYFLENIFDTTQALVKPLCMCFDVLNSAL